MNVLSIDFDWIMEPTIEAYNNLAHGHDPHGYAEIWKIIQNKMPGFEPECDLNKFTDLFFFLKSLAKNISKENIKIAFNHEEIYDFVKDCEELTIYNIDHHHDMGYSKPSERQEDNQSLLEELGCGNWVSYLRKNNNLNQYCWVGNYNSIYPRSEEPRLNSSHLN